MEMDYIRINTFNPFHQPFRFCYGAEPLPICKITLDQMGIFAIFSRYSIAKNLTAMVVPVAVGYIGFPSMGLRNKANLLCNLAC